MFLLSQDRETIVNMDKICMLECSGFIRQGVTSIWANEGSGGLQQNMGEYSTLGRAKAVIQKVYDALGDYERVYEMPEE